MATLAEVVTEIKRWANIVDKTADHILATEKPEADKEKADDPR